MVDLYVTLIESIFYVDDHVANNFNHYRNNLCCIVADSKHIFTTLEFNKHYTRAFLKANRAERSRISFKPIPFSYCTQHSQRPCWIRHEVLRHINKHVSSTSRPTSGPTTAAICTRSPSTKCNAGPPASPGASSTAPSVTSAHTQRPRTETTVRQTHVLKTCGNARR
ncbi:hypothetical protein JTB14_023471 [Gonioctena quinquepunctata]|nr:hypothetical protein JTB14_023471 [Gonioctena quinquepunctata]